MRLRTSIFQITEHVLRLVYLYLHVIIKPHGQLLVSQACCWWHIELFRNSLVHKFYCLKAMITLEQVNTLLVKKKKNLYVLGKTSMGSLAGWVFVDFHCMQMSLEMSMWSIFRDDINDTPCSSCFCSLGMMYFLLSRGPWFSFIRNVYSINSPFHSCKWSWPCFDTTLPALLCKWCHSYAYWYFLNIISVRKGGLYQNKISLSPTFAQRLGC